MILLHIITPSLTSYREGLKKLTATSINFLFLFAEPHVHS